VEVPSGGGSFDVDLVDRFGNAFPTRQVSANATWDLRTLTPFDWADLFLTNATGSYTTQEQNAIIDAVDSWFAAGIWQKRRVINLFTGKNAFDNSLNLCYPFDAENAGRMTFVGSPTHNSNGITFGATSAAVTNMPRLHLPLQSLNIFFYSRTNSVVSGIGLDVCTAPFQPQTYMGLRDNSTDRSLFAGNGTVTTAGTVSDSRGGFHGNFISGVNASKYVKNGDTASPITTLTNGTSLNYGMFSLNGFTGTVQFPTSRNYAGFALGEALTDAEMAADYAIWQQFQTDFNGRQV
jgi:hypothetical protein